MLETLTCADFLPALNQRFELRGNSSVSEVVLITAEPLSTNGPVPRPPFHLVFRGPQAPLLDQRIHALSHPALGALEIFLVPIGPNGEGQCYEAVFG